MVEHDIALCIWYRFRIGRAGNFRRLQQGCDANERAARLLVALVDRTQLQEHVADHAEIQEKLGEVPQ